MIIVNKDNIAVACYEDVTQEEALRAFIEEDVSVLASKEITIDDNGTPSLVWLGKTYGVKSY